MILRTSGIGVSIAFLREAQWGSRGREFDSRHSDHKIQRFHVRNRWIFFVYGLASFGFDHNFDHNAGRDCRNLQKWCYQKRHIHENKFDNDS